MAAFENEGEAHATPSVRRRRFMPRLARRVALLTIT